MLLLKKRVSVVSSVENLKRHNAILQPTGTRTTKCIWTTKRIWSVNLDLPRGNTYSVNEIRGFSSVIDTRIFFYKKPVYKKPRCKGQNLLRNFEYYCDFLRNSCQFFFSIG